MKSKFWAWFAGVVLIASSTLPSQAMEKVIRISAGEWPPFVSHNLENKGYVAEMIKKVFATQGYHVEFVFLPWVRAYHEASEGKFDATAIWMYKPDRAKDFFFSDAVTQEEFVFFHHVDTPFNWVTLQDIEGQTLGGGLGYSYGSELDVLISSNNVNIERVASPQQNFMRLAHKRIDLFPEEVHIGYHFLAQLPPEIRNQITHHASPFLKNDSYLLFPKKSPQSLELLELFNQGLKEYQQSLRNP